MGDPKKPKKRLLSPRTHINTLKGDPVPAAKQHPDVAAALKVGEEILMTIEDEVPSGAKDKNTGFFEGVEEKTNGIIDTISRRNTVSEAQRGALDNMLAAVRKWTRDGRDD